MKSSKTPVHVALRYMTNFRCIGADCEDSCCGGLTVVADAPRLEALRETMSKTEAERAEFAAAIQYRTDEDRRVVALLVQRPDKSCTLLDENKLCTVQQRYGEEALLDDCAVYPRSVGQIAGRVELSGNLSCPEAARLCLLHEGSTDFVPINQTTISRGRIHYTYADSPQDISEVDLDVVRTLAQHLLAAREYRLDSRLFFLATFFDSASLLLRQNAGPRASVHFQALLQNMKLRSVQDQINAQFLGSAASSTFSVPIIVRVLEVMQRLGTTSTRSLFEECFNNRVDDSTFGVSRDSTGTFVFTPEMVAATCEKRRQTLPDAFFMREDALLERFCQNHLVRIWPIWSSNLRAYGIGLFLRIALIRFFLRNHPLLIGSETDLSKIDDLTVRVVYVLARAFDHGVILRSIIESLVETGSDTLENAVSLLKF